MLCSDPPPGTFRKPSPLVDTIVALCMQYGVAFLPPQGPAGGVDHSTGLEDGHFAGWSYYYPCRVVLESEMERPTLSTLQTLVLQSSTCSAQASKTRPILARADRPSRLYARTTSGATEDTPRPERELRKRLWWAVYVTEAKTCMKLGRPWNTSEGLITCSLPANDHGLALRSGSNTALMTTGGSTVTWMTYTLQNTKLVLAARSVYASFFGRCSHILNLASGTLSSYDDPVALEAAANALKSDMAGPSGLKVWQSELPTGLKTQRGGNSVPSSDDLRPLDIKWFAPAWLRHQRLFLELRYHTLMINLHCLFVVLPAPTSGAAEVSGVYGNLLPATGVGPLAMSHACTAARHAVAITTILHQVVAEMDLPKGCHETFSNSGTRQSPRSAFCWRFPQTPSSRRALSLAIPVSEAFGRHFSAGGDAANATRDLVSKIELAHDAGMRNKQQPFAQFSPKNWRRAKAREALGSTGMCCPLGLRRQRQRFSLVVACRAIR